MTNLHIVRTDGRLPPRNSAGHEAQRAEGQEPKGQFNFSRSLTQIKSDLAALKTLIDDAYRAIDRLPPGSARQQLYDRLTCELRKVGLARPEQNVPNRQRFAYLMAQAADWRAVAHELDRAGYSKRAALIRKDAKEAEEKAWRAADAPKQTQSNVSSRYLASG